ncbi:hypothetical protein Bpfe_020644, partial [Biomphalaria pfeifferi]
LQIYLAYSSTTYQQMFDGLSGSSLNTMKITTLWLHSDYKVLFSFTTQILQKKKILKAIGYQQCTPMIHKSSLPRHSAKRCVHLFCTGSDGLYCTSLS